MGGQISGFKLRRRDDTVPGKPAKYGVVFFAEQEEPVRGKLQVTADDIVLFQKSKEARIWPIRSIRRYGCEGERFEIESGRRCPGGPGFYTFQSKHAERIFAGVEERVREIAQGYDSARIVSAEQPHRISPQQPPQPPVSNRPQSSRSNNVTPTTNQYLNCDSQGRFNGHLVNGESSGDARPAIRHSDDAGVQYADLDLSTLERADATGLPRTPPRAKSFSPRHSGDGVGLGLDAKSMTFVDGKRDSTSSVSYAKIDPTKSRAVALSRMGP